MDQFNLLVPKEKCVACLEDLDSLSVKELKIILSGYKEKVSGIKADPVLRVYAIFCRINQQEGSSDSTHQSSLIPLESQLCTYHEIFNFQCHHLTWTSDLCGTPYFTFVQLYDYLVIRTMKFKHILLKSAAYKRLSNFL